jgi:hypothetical protein
MQEVYVDDDRPYGETYTAYLLGWVTQDSGIHAIVAEGDGDAPWLVRIAQVRLKV